MSKHLWCLRGKVCWTGCCVNTDIPMSKTVFFTVGFNVYSHHSLCCCGVLMLAVGQMPSKAAIALPFLDGRGKRENIIVSAQKRENKNVQCPEKRDVFFHISVSWYYSISKTKYQKETIY